MYYYVINRLFSLSISSVTLFFSFQSTNLQWVFFSHRDCMGEFNCTSIIDVTCVQFSVGARLDQFNYWEMLAMSGTFFLLQLYLLMWIRCSECKLYFFLHLLCFFVDFSLHRLVYDFYYTRRLPLDIQCFYNFNWNLKRNVVSEINASFFSLSIKPIDVRLLASLHFSSFSFFSCRLSSLNHIKFTRATLQTH